MERYSNLPHVQERIIKLRKTWNNNIALMQKRIRMISFKFAPFSIKQKKILTWWCDNSPVREMEGIIADGAIRSGKTVSMSMSFGLWAMTNFNGQNFLMCGKTIGSLRRNVISVWKTMMLSCGYKIREIRTDNLLIVSKNDVVNYFYMFGGKDERSQDLVQGITAAGVLFDEVALMPESFVNQATGRCSVEGRKFWFNCNPDNRKHWFHVNWIEKAKEKNILYLHFTMHDNLSLSEKIKEGYRKMYSGMFFRRFIQGEWCTADGVIYDMFCDKKHTFEKAPISLIGRRYITIDYGTTNPMVFLDILDTGKIAYILREYYYDSKKEGRQKSDIEYANDFDDFVGSDIPDYVVIDPSAASFRVELRNRGYRVKEADNEVLDGIRMVASMLNLNLLQVHISCVNTINEFLSYVWDKNASMRGVEQPIKQNDHALDALRYFIKTILKNTNNRRFTES